MQALSEVNQKMQQDWNARAQEDAHFYVAFGRRGQDDAEFFDTAREVVRALESEIKRLPKATKPRARRALEIGCGPGRLMKPMSAHFGEIHGVDVSDEMIRRAASNLQDVPHAHPHHTSGSDLAPFADESFDLVYSYAVFQHIPSAEVVFNYLNEAVRVLKPGGIIRAQLNGLPKTAKVYDTWSGVRISGDEIKQFARGSGLQLLALEGVNTQYMWTTLRKPDGAEEQHSGEARIRRITNSHSSEPVAPTRGRFASVTLWVENFPPAADLNSVEVEIGGLPSFATYLGPREADGLQQFNAMLPEGVPTGLLPIVLRWRGELLATPNSVRVIPAAPQVPILLSVTDGINMLSGTRIVTGTLKATIEETSQPEAFHASIDGVPVKNVDIFCADPLPSRYEINFEVPEQIGSGPHRLEMQLGRRKLAPIAIEVVR